MPAFPCENLSHDPIHGYIPFTAASHEGAQGTLERAIIDHRWVQRLRHIHQLQTAWWVYPTAEHTRFAHVLGAMHLASRMVRSLYDSLKLACPDVPSLGYVETLLRMAGLLHDVGHGPFGHFFDEQFLRPHGLTHETLGARIIVDELGELLRGLRANPYSQLEASEQLDPRQVAWLITRPRLQEADAAPRWLQFLRSLLSGIYTIDNLDFVLRDAYMSGYSQRAFDLERLLHYSFFSDQGLTIHDRGIDALVRFMTARAELFRAIYFHRTVRAIDLTLADLFPATMARMFPQSPADNLDAYCRLTESTFWVDVGRWADSTDAELRALGQRWQRVLARDIPWKTVCQRTRVFGASDAEQASIFSDGKLVEQRVRSLLPEALQDIELRVDVARHIFRPHTRGPAAGQNFLYDAAHHRVRPLEAHELFQRLPISQRIIRIYSRSREHAAALASALDQLLGGHGEDDVTNM